MAGFFAHRLLFLLPLITGICSVYWYLTLFSLVRLFIVLKHCQISLNMMVLKHAIRAAWLRDCNSLFAIVSVRTPSHNFDPYLEGAGAPRVWLLVWIMQGIFLSQFWNHPYTIKWHLPLSKWIVFLPKILFEANFSNHFVVQRLRNGRDPNKNGLALWHKISLPPVSTPVSRM